ncbi:probetacellulin-like [Acipenser oxyrinchus oxyrinchus]|uniref:Probetacellulin n=1 Tax=Acipenser oxyrinchus oxyrinchus TaxID=40147 RepID=A0AAD8GHL0_ACIOX|nr:probetacellulin-like [Acipenser oxyrinchus oxyrinchus]
MGALRICKQVLAILTGLTLCKYAHADWNATRESETGAVLCDNLEDDNCTEVIEHAKRRGHFSKCPKEYKHYCIKGKCRYVVDEQEPACICEKGYIGSRCELLDFFYQRGDQKQIIIASLIAAMVLLIILIIFICICAHRQKMCHKPGKKKESEEIEKLNTFPSDNKENIAVNLETSETNTV